MKNEKIPRINSPNNKESSMTQNSPDPTDLSSSTENQSDFSLQKENSFRFSEVICATMKNADLIQSIIPVITQNVSETIKPQICQIVEDSIKPYNESIEQTDPVQSLTHRYTTPTEPVQSLTQMVIAVRQFLLE